MIDNNILIATCACACLGIAAVCLLFYAINKIQDKRVAELSNAMTTMATVQDQRIKAFNQGAELVMESLRRDGRLAPAGQVDQDDINPEHIDSFYNNESAESAENETGIPDILIARSQQAAEQMGQNEFKKVMGEMDNAAI